MTDSSMAGHWIPALSFGVFFVAVLLVIIVCWLSARYGSLYRRASLAKELCRRGRTSEALDLMEAVIRSMPDDPELLADFGATLFKAGHIDEAERQFRRAHALDARLPEASYGLGHCLLGSSPESAERCFDEAMRLDPALASAVEGRGLARLAAGRLTDAAEDFASSCRLNPSGATSHINAGVAAMALGDGKSAEMHFRDAVRLDPDNAVALSNLGAFLGSEQKNEEAVLYLERAVAAEPASVKERIGLAYLYRRLGRNDAAIRHLTDVAPHAPDNADVCFRLGIMLEETGRKEEARIFMRRAAALDPRLAGDEEGNASRVMVTTPVFENMDEEDIRRLSSSGRRLHLAAGELLIDEGDISDSIFLVEDGSFTVRRTIAGNVSRERSRLGPGHVIGEVSFIDRGMRSASVLASEAARVLEIPFSAMDRMIVENPDAGRILLRNLGRILSARIRFLDEDSRDRLQWGVRT